MILKRYFWCGALFLQISGAFANPCRTLVSFLAHADDGIQRLERLQGALKEENERLLNIYSTSSDAEISEIIAEIRQIEGLPSEISADTVKEFYRSARIPSLLRVIAELRGDFYTKIVLQKVDPEKILKNAQETIEKWNQLLRFEKIDLPEPEIFRQVITKMVDQTSVKELSEANLLHLVLAQAVLKQIGKLEMAEFKMIRDTPKELADVQADLILLKQKEDEIISNLPLGFKEMDFFDSTLAKMYKDNDLAVELCCFCSCHNCPYGLGLRNHFHFTPKRLGSESLSTSTLAYYRAAYELRDILPPDAFVVEKSPASFKRRLVQLRHPGAQ